MNDDEKQIFRVDGRSYLQKLSREIQDSAPIVGASKSKYKGRDVSKQYEEKVIKCI